MMMYFIAIVLPEELNEEIKKHKIVMLEKWGSKVGLKSPAHITIIPPFWMDETMEPGLLSDVDSLSKNIPSFTVHTHNFSAFKPRTIFIDVQVDDKLKAVKKEANRFFKALQHYKVKIETRPFHPHITIATRDLHKKAFFEAWPLFEKQEFAASFSALGLSVLRHNKRDWDVIHTGPFETNTLLNNFVEMNND